MAVISVFLVNLLLCSDLAHNFLRKQGPGELCGIKLKSGTVETQLRNWTFFLPNKMVGLRPSPKFGNISGLCSGDIP